MIREILKDAESHMNKTVDVFKHELASLRTGRASVTIFENIRVDYFGTEVPINQLATISAPDATLVVISPFDPSSIGALEKAIQTSDLGLNPSNDGKLIRVPIPPLTEERRKSLGKKIHEYEEECKIAIRNIRRDARDKVKELLKEKEITEDQEHKAEDDIQQLTDDHVEQISELAKKKEHDIMEV